MRDETEWVELVDIKATHLVGCSTERIIESIEKCKLPKGDKGQIIWKYHGLRINSGRAE